MKEKVKQIFALSGVIICILVLLSNIIFTVANASSNQITIEGFKKYETAIKNGIGLIQKKYYLGYCEDTSFTYITKDDMSDVTLVAKPNQIYTQGGANSIKLFTDNVNDTNVKYSSYFSGGSNLSYSSSTLIDKVRFFVTNAPKGSFTINDEYGYQIYYLDENGNDITNAVDKNDIIFEHYYNKLSDLSHDITITNNSSKDIYYTLRCVMPQNMAAINSYEHLMYMYKEKQEYNGITAIKYNQLVNASAETAAEWISQYFASQTVLNDYNITQNEIYNNLMSDTAFWHRTNIYTSGTLGLPYMTAFDIPQSEMGAESEHNAIITTLNNNVVNVSYTVDGYSNGNVYENTSIIKLNSGETKNIKIPQNYMSLNNGVYYQWVLSVGEATDKITEHSRKGFIATTSNVGVIPPENIGSDKYVYDEQGNIIGEFDGNGNIVIFDNNNNTPSLDVPQFDTTSFKGIVSSVGEVVQMSYKMLPPEVYAIIAFGLGVVLAIGIIRLVTG